MFNIEKPNLIQQLPRGYAIRFALDAGEGPEGEPGFNYEEVAVPDLNYSTVVSGIIHHRYDLNAEIAMLNNHINDPEGRSDEWQEYQDWRDFAKNYTKATLGIRK